MTPIETEYLFDADAHLEPVPLLVGAVPDGQRGVAYVTGGTIEGPRIRGEILPGGGDWLLIRADGTLKIDVRVCARTHDGTVIYMSYGGRLVFSPEQMTLLADRSTADAVDPSTYYFRTNPLFEVDMASPYAWLNRVVAIGVGRVTSRGVAYSVHAVK